MMAVTLCVHLGTSTQEVDLRLNSRFGMNQRVVGARLQLKPRNTERTRLLPTATHWVRDISLRKPSFTTKAPL